MMANSSQPNSTLGTMPAPWLDDEIDLSALGAALVRRWRWVIGFSFTGLLLGCAMAFQKQPQVGLELILDVSQGPQQLQPIPPVLSGAALSIRQSAPYQSRYTTQSAVLLLNQALIANFGNAAERRRFIVGPPNRKDLRSAPLVALSVDVQEDQVADYRSLLAQIKRYVVAASSQGLLQGDIPATQHFVQILAPEERSSHPQRFWILGGLAGLVVGMGAAMLADRLVNRAFTVSEILLRLGYPLRAKLPPLPWEANSIQSEFEQLATGLDVNLRWYVLSIAESHALVRPLVTALQCVRPELQVDEAAPLLAQPLRIPQAGLPRAFLLVVECGFNSPQALSEARRVLDQMPHLEAVGLVLVGQPLPPELRS